VNDDAEEGEAIAAQRAVDLEVSLVPELSGAVGVTRSEYAEDGFIGSRFVLREAPLTAFADTGNAEGLTIARSGDRILLEGSLNASGVEGEANNDSQNDAAPNDTAPSDDAEPSGDISVVVTFPGEVLSHDGSQSGRTVTWSTEFDEPITISAESEIDQSVDLTPVWWGLAIVLLVGVLAIVIVVMRRRARSSAPSNDHSV
jgi:hypothetical protein